MAAHNGTRFGAFGDPFDWSRTFCTSCKDGSTFTFSIISNFVVVLIEELRMCVLLEVPLEGGLGLGRGYCTLT